MKHRGAGQLRNRRALNAPRPPTVQRRGRLGSAPSDRTFPALCTAAAKFAAFAPDREQGPGGAWRRRDMGGGPASQSEDELLPKCPGTVAPRQTQHADGWTVRRVPAPAPEPPRVAQEGPGSGTQCPPSATSGSIDSERKITHNGWVAELTASEQVCAQGGKRRCWTEGGRRGSKARRKPEERLRMTWHERHRACARDKSRAQKKWCTCRFC
jgi:hypothetical protein